MFTRVGILRREKTNRSGWKKIRKVAKQQANIEAGPQHGQIGYYNAHCTRILPLGINNKRINFEEKKIKRPSGANTA